MTNINSNGHLDDLAYTVCIGSKQSEYFNKWQNSTIIPYKRIMKTLKFLVITLLLIVIGHRSGFSQTKRETIYYLADTAGVRPGNRILVIGEELKNSYSFFCKCIPPFNAYLNFLYRDKPKFLSSLPNHRYLSWIELQDVAYNSGTKFNENYIFYIIEKLPKGYQEALVEFRMFKLAGTTEWVNKVLQILIESFIDRWNRW